MDPGRVIFSHRIIPISGGRFHVLSCIRDAGADYTGRTNHIAHHVIAEARELAQLRSQGASPADVLLKMPWAAKWDEPPLYFEASDEVNLANFTPQTGADGAHWARVTGNASHAWLLAAGEASRGAYVIPPPEADLRWLFADSLRLAPERLWQISFTTSLQSKDEISDYRWIGLESDSPLRNETGASGRAVLDLTQPHLLPAPEAAAPATYPSNARAPMAAGRGASDFSSGAAAPSAQSVSTAPSLVSSKQAPTAPEPLPDFFPPTKVRRFPFWILWTLAAILLATALVIWVFLPWKHRMDLRSQIVHILKWSEYFPDNSLDSIAVALLPDSKSWPLAEESAKSLNQIATALMQGRLENITSDDERQLRALIGKDGVPPPPEITRLQGLLDTAKEKSHWQPALKSAKEAVQLQQAATDDINGAVPNPPYEKLNKELRALADARIAQAEYDLLTRHTSTQPPESAAIFGKSLSELKSRISPGNDRALEILARADAIVALWEVTDSASSLSPSERIAAIKKRDGENAAKWPAWLLKKVVTRLKTNEDKFASANPRRTAPGSPQIPLYVVGDIPSLKDAHFNELRAKLAYYLQSPPEGEMRQLRDPGNEGRLRLNISENPVFLVNESAAQITPERAGEALRTPFCLIAKDASDHEVMEIWVGAGPDKPFLPDRKISVTRSANVLSVNLEDLSLPGEFKTPLRLRLPDEYNVSGKANESLPMSDGKAEIGGLLDDLTERRTATAKAVESLKNSLNLKSENPQADFATRKYLVIQAARLDDELRAKGSQASRDLGKDSAQPFQQCGNLIVAITHHTDFPGAEDLFKIGHDLADLPDKAEPRVIAANLSTASIGVARSLASMRAEIQQANAERQAAQTQEQRRPIEQRIEQLTKAGKIYEPMLLRLKELIDSLLPETAQAKAAREAAETQLREKLKNAEKELEQITAHPLLSLPPGGAPAGTYRLLARTPEGGEVLLLKLEAAP